MASDAFKTFGPDDNSRPPSLPLKIAEQILVKAAPDGSGIALSLETPPGLGHLQTQWFLSIDQAAWLANQMRDHLRELRKQT